MFVVLTVCLVLGHTGRPLARAALVFIGVGRSVTRYEGAGAEAPEADHGTS